MVEVEWTRVLRNEDIHIRLVIVIPNSKGRLHWPKIESHRIISMNHWFPYIPIWSYLHRQTSIICIPPYHFYSCLFWYTFYRTTFRYRTTIRSILLNSMECWAVEKLNELDMSVAEMPILHRMCGSLWEIMCETKIFVQRHV